MVNARAIYDALRPPRALLRAANDVDVLSKPTGETKDGASTDKKAEPALPQEEEGKSVETPAPGPQDRS